MKYLICILFFLMLWVSPCFADKEWKEYKTDNFKIYARHVNEDFTNTVMMEAQETLETVLENFGIRKSQVWSKKNPVSIYIYENEEDYVKNGQQAGWSHGAALIQSRSIRTYPSASGFFDSILPHELGHIVLHEYLGIHVPVPLWFDEGVAMYQEKARQLGGHKAAAEAIKNGKFIPLTELTNMRLYSDTDQETVRLFYVESASVVNFMITQLGDFHFRKLCRLLKEHRSFHNALTEAYPRIKNLEDLNKQWVRYLTEND